MKAILLAAGFGTRLKPLTNTTPKALLPVGGVPLIYYPLSRLKAAGLTEIVINLHHLGDLIEKKLGDGRPWGLKIRYSWERILLGTGGGIKKSARLCGSYPLLVINSDVLFDFSLQDLMAFHRSRGGIATMMVRHRPPDSPHTPITMKGERIVHMDTDRVSAPAASDKRFFFTGIQILEEPLIRQLPEGFSSIIQEGYQRALARGDVLHGLIQDGYWNDLGTPDRLQEAERDVISGRVAPPSLE